MRYSCEDGLALILRLLYYSQCDLLGYRKRKKIEPVCARRVENQMTYGLAEYLEAVNELRETQNRTTFYRGHGSLNYKSIPKVFRDIGWEQSEHSLIRDLVQLHPEEFAGDRTTLEKLVRAQHFGLATRLLDVTLNPLVALYFCCRESLDSDGRVLHYAVDQSRIKSFDSDTVSVIANTALLNSDEKDSIRELVHDHFNTKSSMPAIRFNKKQPIPKLHHFICEEKPYFIPKIKPSTFRQYIAVLPKRNNKRMIAQSGAFIVFPQNLELTESRSPRISIQEVVIPADSKRLLIGQLDRININLSALFPEMSMTSEYLLEKHSIPI